MRVILLCLLVFFQVCSASAQQKATRQTAPNYQDGMDPSPWMFGGNLGFTFGDYTFVNASPMIGYRFSSYIAAGFNINAQYASRKFTSPVDGSTTQRNNYSILGGGIFARVYPIEQFFIQAQPEINRISFKNTYYTSNQNYSKGSYMAPSLLMGAGYVQPVSSRAAVTFMVLYDVLQDPNSPYLNRPIFSGGVNIGF
jgi:hypothetical protein